jgi:phosphate transport system substrate-binding protein
MKKLIVFVSLALFAVEANATRKNVSIAGSSTVLPFATIIAEQVGKNPNNKTPVVESGGSSVGKKGVCEGTGLKYIDIGNASSRMKVKELKYCKKNNVDVTEIKVGYDGIVVASSKKGTLLKISKYDLGKALTAKVPVNGKMVDNPYKKWSDINPSLPNLPIKVMGPPTTSGTRASFVEMVNQKGYCKKSKEVKAIGYKSKKCRAMRTDGAYVEAGEQDNLIVKKLQSDPNTFGIFGFSYLDQNMDVLQGAIIDGNEPSFENIADGKYSISRALYFYVKHSHLNIVPGVKEYVNEWTKHWGEDGILADAGMIPLPDAEKDIMLSRMKTWPALKAEDLK